MAAILLLATIQSWFFVFAILRFKQNKEFSDLILSVWFVLIGLHTLIYFAYSSGFELSIYALILNASFPFLQGPLLFFYVNAKVGRLNKIEIYHYLHFIPFLSYLFYQLYHLHFPELNSNGEPVYYFAKFFSPDNPFGIFFLVSIPLYLTVCFLRTRTIGQGLENRVWVHLIILFITGIWISSLISFFKPESLGHQLQIVVNYLIFIILTGFIYLISYFGIKEYLFVTDIPKIGGEKYIKSKLSQSELAKIRDSLDRLMLSDKPYLNPDLGLSLLAEKLDTTPNKLSQAINIEYDKSFNDYVNKFRVNHAKKLIHSDEAKHFSLLAIGLESGFSSKSTFNRAFKKFENQTPSNFKNSIKK